ncbi:hypothetical protein MMC07_004530 [Pseudocyphellaria aurata]|nr:hypothetical protein [Pseudocyphellaria aurata]
MATMTFDPPPTSEQVSNNSGRRFPFSYFRRSPSQEPPAYVAEDFLASKYQKASKLLSSIRVATSLITLALSIAIIACADNSLRAYTSTNLGGEWFLPLWPAKVDLRPTHAVLACGIVVLVSSVAYLVAALFPSPRPKIHRLNIASTVISFVGLFITLFTTISASTVNSHLSDNSGSATLMTWTCKWQGLESIAPDQFEKICTETMISLDLVILLLIFEVFAVAVTGWGWWVETRSKSGSDNTIKLESLERGSA